jgi:hypothetical protein
MLKEVISGAISMGAAKRSSWASSQVVFYDLFGDDGKMGRFKSM